MLIYQYNLLKQWGYVTLPAYTIEFSKAKKYKLCDDIKVIISFFVNIYGRNRTS